MSSDQKYNSTTSGRKQFEGAKDFSSAVNFLKQLRPDGPWILTAILPDKSNDPGIPFIITTTTHTTTEASEFVSLHNGNRNLYYSANPTKGPMSKKAAKTDIAAIEYLLADLDPRDDETPEAAKTRYLEQLATFEPKPTAIIDSGNGIQCLWRLLPRILLSSASEDVIADVEVRSAALMTRLGAKAGTQNIDRILRLPGTINLPNKAKRKSQPSFLV